MNILIAIGITFNISITIYCLMLTYSEYARARGLKWVLYLVLSFIPIINLVYMITHVLNSPFIEDDILLVLDPLLVAKFIKYQANKELQCSKCDTAFYRWAGEHHIFAEAVVIRCPKCSDIESVSSSVKDGIKIEGHKLSITESVSYRRSLLKQHKKYKQQLSEGA